MPIKKPLSTCEEKGETLKPFYLYLHEIHSSGIVLKVLTAVPFVPLSVHSGVISDMPDRFRVRQ